MDHTSPALGNEELGTFFAGLFDHLDDLTASFDGHLANSERRFLDARRAGRELLSGSLAVFDEVNYILDRPCEDDLRFPPETGLLAKEIQAAALHGLTRGLGIPLEEADRFVASLLGMPSTRVTTSD